MVDAERAGARLEKLIEDLAKIREEGEEAYLADTRQRNLLVHLYLEIDDLAVFDSLKHLDDLREFGTIVGRQVG